MEFIFCKAKITAALFRFINSTLLAISPPRLIVRVRTGSARKGAVKSVKSSSSARVSIGSIDIAKVARDQFMNEQNVVYPGYGFASNW